MNEPTLAASIRDASIKDASINDPAIDARISIPGLTVVFDYGEVISRFPDDASRRRIEELAGVDPAALWASYGAHRHALDHGRLTATAYWRAVEADTGADWSRTRVHELWAADFPSWFVPEPGTLDVIADLADGGTRLAILSNAGQDFASPFRHSPLGDLFEQVYLDALVRHGTERTLGAAQGLLQQQVNGQPESMRLKRQLDRVYAGLHLPAAHG